ncbi:EcoKI restriction-modification system protein HsdS [Candidatus Methylomirabilis lanthanidiphila]|uniref:EcoKI restriction-modification system protein HsdS n=1 Tax=Candidatus Methylomirabilis lanthanidiphila TaxID=2211376 RepID=A0A564ZH67_9BACT|nr:restriction endonuclease subunit S [Candidatus Methylomirabilis lanthanidiphila]VUZ83888.1 EcoKI restriction-modification system protein HsdS [Candidatus Methylomirabilis lanthanidiphila]
MPEKLKKGWCAWRFDQMAIMVNDRIDNPAEADVEHYIGLEHLDSDSLTIRRWGTPSDVEAAKLRFRKGDIIFGRRRVYQRKLAVAQFDGICSAHAMVLRAKPEVALPEFLPFFMQSDLFMERAKQISVGSLSPTINWKTLAQEEFALPPMEEQRQIAEALGASDTCGQAVSRVIDHLRAVRRAAIDCLTGLADWPRTTIGDFCQMQNGRPFPGKAYGEDGIRLLRPGNLGQSGFLAWDPSKTTWLPKMWEEEAREFVVDAGDVVMNLTAQSLEDGFMGRVCLAREGDRSLLNQRIGRFRNWSPDVLPEYVFRVFQTSRFQRHAIEMCEGSKVKHIFWPHISRYELVLPPLHEQERAVGRLRAVDALLDQAIERRVLSGGLHRQMMATMLQVAGEATGREPIEGTRK